MNPYQNGRIPNGAVGGAGSPRLPPLGPEAYQGQTANALLDQSYGFYAAMQQANTDDRRSRQLLEDQVKVITAVCKKLNQDIEALDSQINDKSYQLSSLENKSNDLQANTLSQMKDIQYRVSRHESSIMKNDGDLHGLQNAIKDLQMQFQDSHRNTMMRLNDTDKRISELNTKFDSILTEQTMVLKNVEGDTIKQLSLIDSKTRTMLEDVRAQMNNIKASNEGEMIRLESRILLKIDDAQRNTDKYDRLDRKLEDINQAVNKRFSNYEDDFQKNLNKLSSAIDKLDTKVNKGMEDKFSRNKNEIDKFKGDLKTGMADIQQTIITLQKVIEGKIKLSEDRLEKEVDKIRKMVVLM